MNEELPQVIINYLEARNLVAVEKQELIDLRGLKLNREERRNDQCPYPLFHRPWIPGNHLTHDEYLGTIVEKEDDIGSGVHVMRCAACGRISLETPVIIG